MNKAFVIPREVDLDTVELEQGEYIYGVKNDVTREYVWVKATSRDQAIARAGFFSENVRWTQIVKTPPKPMGEKNKQRLRELNEQRKAERAKERVDLSPVEETPEAPPPPKATEAPQKKVKVADGLKSIWDSAEAANASKEERIAAIAQFLKERNPQADVTQNAKWYFHKLNREHGGTCVQ